MFRISIRMNEEYKEFYDEKLHHRLYYTINDSMQQLKYENNLYLRPPYFLSSHVHFLAGSICTLDFVEKIHIHNNSHVTTSFLYFYLLRFILSLSNEYFSTTLESIKKSLNREKPDEK